jgi:hypothetical protein
MRSLLAESNRGAKARMKKKDNAERDEHYAAWVGFDWGDQEHVWALQWTDTGERERGRLEQTPEALDVWMGQLMSRLNGRRIGVAIEQKHGAVVWMLLKYECVEIYPVHPQASRAVSSSPVSLRKQE